MFAPPPPTLTSTKPGKSKLTPTLVSITTSNNPVAEIVTEVVGYVPLRLISLLFFAQIEL